MPTSEGGLVMIDLGVASQRQVFVQQLGDCISGAGIRTAVLCNSVGALGQLVLDVMADQRTEFQIALSSNFRKVVLPNKQIFVILPGCLVPEGRISIRTPVGRQAHTRRLREDRG